MNSYPFTSQVTYDEQGLPEYDRAVDSSFLRKVFAQYFSDGIFYKPTSALQVSIDTGMNVKVLPGVCHIQGAVGIEDAERVLAVQASETQDRIDTVVARLDLSLEARSIDLYVVKGTASESPVAPMLTRNSTIWELGLANIFVAKNTATITQQRITDTRLDNSRCGVVAQTIGTLDTSPYFAQVQAMISDLEKTIEGIEGGSGYVFSLEGKSGNLTLKDIGALPDNSISGGSSGGGSWVKFPDGTMICYGYVRITQTTPSEGVSTYTITFPQTFEGTPCPQITILDDSAVVYTIQIRRTTGTEMLIQIYNSSKYDSGGTGISWSAFGRWE